MSKAPKIARVLKALLMPVARFSLRHSVKIQEITEYAKAALLEAAASELEKMDEKVTMSRLNAMTGLHRRDIKRIFKEGELRDYQDDFLTRTIGLWAHARRYTDTDGNPKPLHYGGEESEFRELVMQVNNDIDAKTVLFELERVGAAKRNGNLVELLVDAKSVKEDPDAAYALLARDINDIAYAVEENIGSSQVAPNLHVRTRYDNLLVEELPQIRKWILRRGSEFHRDIREYLAKYDLDLHPELSGKGGGEVIVGAFARSKEEDSD